MLQSKDLLSFMKMWRKRLTLISKLYYKNKLELFMANKD